MTFFKGEDALRLQASLRKHDVNISPLELASGP